MKTEYPSIAIAAACLGWGGAGIAGSGPGWEMRSVNLVLFAFGIILFARLPVMRLAAKVRALEDRARS